MRGLTHLAELDTYGERIAGLEHEPLRVTVCTVTPVSCSAPPALDGILAWAVVALALRGRPFPQDVGLVWQPLPLAADRFYGGLPLWQSTDFLPVNPTVGATNIHRRTEDNPYALAGLRATLGEKRPRRFPSSVAGQYINMRVPTRRIVAERWTATCVGNSAEIRRLLSHVSHFGKFAAHGLGRVLDWHVEPAESFSFHDADGQPLRPIPSENGEGAVQGWTPPYWRRETWRFCHSSAARRSIC